MANLQVLDWDQKTKELEQLVECLQGKLSDAETKYDRLAHAQSLDFQTEDDCPEVLYWDEENTLAVVRWPWLCGAWFLNFLLPAMGTLGMVFELLAKFGVLPPELALVKIVAVLLLGVGFSLVLDAAIVKRILGTFHFWFLWGQYVAAQLFLADMYGWTDMRAIMCIFMAVEGGLTLLADAGPPQVSSSLQLSYVLDLLWLCLHSAAISHGWFPDIKVRTIVTGSVSWSTGELYISRCSVLAIFSAKYLFNDIRNKSRAFHLLDRGPVIRGKSSTTHRAQESGNE